MILLPQKIAYRGSVSDLRISAVDGTAFLDACAALVPYADGAHLVEIYPSGGGALGLKGYLKAQGAGETVGGDVVVYGDFADDTKWACQYGWEITGGQLVGTAAGANTHKLTLGVGAPGTLQKIGATISDYVSGRVYITLAGDKRIYATISGDGSTTQYWTRIGTDNTLYISGQTGTFTGKVDDVTICPVLTPTTDGCTIVDSKGGTNYNFAYKNAGFVYNAASYYVIVRKAR